MEIKEILLDLRKRSGLTQEAMAEKLFVTRQAVSRWETGETTPNTETLKLLSKEFNVSINSLLGEPQQLYCQSCSMPLNDIDELGTDADGGITLDFCVHCYSDGTFNQNIGLEEMVEINLQFLDSFNAQNGTSLTEDEARVLYREHLATLKRWKV